MPAERYEDWMVKAKCKEISDPDVFFPKPDFLGGKVNYRPAKSICRTCPVKAVCLTYAVVHRERGGVWGGRTPQQRTMLHPTIKQRFRELWPLIVSEMRLGNMQIASTVRHEIDLEMSA